MMLVGQALRLLLVWPSCNSVLPTSTFQSSFAVRTDVFDQPGGFAQCSFNVVLVGLKAVP